MISRILLAFAALVTFAHPVAAQQWTIDRPSGERAPVWVDAPVIGDGVDRHPEVSTTTQGGDPPALAYEPAALDEQGIYTRSQWLNTPSLPGDRQDQGEAKFRLTCAFSHFGTFDPILYFGQAKAGHHHTFIGNKSVNGSSTYTTLRQSPASTCTGGPLNGTAYWEPTLFFEIQPGVNVPIKPNVVSFYYTESYTKAPELYRLLRGLAFIGGVDPNDRLNTARLAELPDGQGWDKSRRYNGWNGYGCYNGSTLIPVAAGNTADEGTTGFARQLVNADGSDPWAGACEGTDKIIIASVNAPDCWNGHDLTSPNGRDHFRYATVKSASQSVKRCPNGWWKVPKFEVKTEFANGHVGLGISGHAWRSKLSLSSDRMSANPANWQPRGSTFHFDWMNGWDSVIQQTWHSECNGVTQNGVAGNPLTCNDSTISSTQKLKNGTPPVAGLSDNPILTSHDYAIQPARNMFGPVEENTVVTATGVHDH